MADNTYTAFDPIFYSYHAKVDRIAASFMPSHSEEQYSSNFPLQPLVNNTKGLVYPNIKCTTESYTIDIFPVIARSSTADHTTSPDYIGRLTRLGMVSGPWKRGLINKQRCHKTAILRAMPAADHETQLKKSDWKVRFVVRRLKTGEQVGEGERKEIGGFEGRVVWKI